jgi:hypothetical protein
MRENRLALDSLEEDARRYVHGVAPMKNYNG